MLNINMRTAALRPMLDWLKTSKEQGIRDESRLREILNLEDYLFGLIDHALGKERLFEALKKPELLIATYNEAAKLTGNDKYILH